MNYSEWLEAVPGTLKEDAVWTVTAYRYAVFLSDLSWKDVTKLVSDKRTQELASQLYDAVGSVGANLAEGFSRGSGRDRARFYEYSLGSARESRDWYFKARFILTEKVSLHRMEFLAEIIRLTLTMITDQRPTAFHEPPVAYTSSNLSPMEPSTIPLLSDIPQPP